MSRMTEYRFPFVKDENGYPKITREMTPRQYDGNYKPALTEIRKQMDKNLETIIKLEENGRIYESRWGSAAVELERVVPLVQDTEYYRAFLYPTKNFPNRTLDIYGEFMIVTGMVLKYFGIKNVEPEGELLQIANYGDWQHNNGTWHHYIDTVCEAYGISTTRLSKVQQMIQYMKRGGLTVVLLDNKMFPGSIGNCLVLVTEIVPRYNWVGYYFPGGPEKSEHFRGNSLGDFVKGAKVIWGFELD